MIEKFYINKYFNGHKLTRQVDWDPYNPLNLPPYTIRLLYENGITPVFEKGTGVRVSQSPNIWDLTYNNNNWSLLLDADSENNHAYLLKVLGANSTGVTNMSYMFDGAIRLNEISLFDTSSVTTMQRMFSNIGGLGDYVNIPLFDTSNVTNMMGMFLFAHITTIPLFNTSKVTRTDSMFMSSGVRELPNLNFSRVYRAANMFQNCVLTTIPNIIYNMRSLTEATEMFSNCQSLQDIPLFDTSKLTAVGRMFDDCINVKTGIFELYSQISTQTNVPASHQFMFQDCGSNTSQGRAALAKIPVYWGGTKY